MNKKWWIIGSVIVIGAGVGAYFLFRKPKEDKEGNKRIVYGPQEPFDSSGDVGGEERYMGSFNPCIETKVVPAKVVPG